MNFLILGDGPDERAWAEVLAGRPDHRVIAAVPGFPDLFPDIPTPDDLEAGLAIAGVEAVIVGGPLDQRDEALRRTAASGFAAICIHPPGLNADPYYQVALSRDETGAVVVPDLPGRLHPGVEALRSVLTPLQADAFPGLRVEAERKLVLEAREAQDLGEFRGLRIEAPGASGDRSLLESFSRWVDLVRDLVGEVESLTALGDPPGDSPTRTLTVQLRGPSGRPAELRLSPPVEGASSRVLLEFRRGTLAVEIAPNWTGPARLTRSDGGETTAEEIPPWDPQGALLDAFQRAVVGGVSHPDLVDATRAMELTSAAARSLRRGRSVDLHYEEVSEASNFKTIMTSVGCMVLLGILVALPAALVGPALGIGQTIYIAYAIPPLLVVFALLQVLRLAMKPPGPSSKAPPEDFERV